MERRVFVWIALFACWAGCSGRSMAQVAPSVWPRCIPERDGQQIGLGGSICECRYEAGGTMIRRPRGWRWSCDIMQMDGGRADVLSDGYTGQQSLPPGFVYAPQTSGPRALFDGGHRR